MSVADIIKLSKTVIEKSSIDLARLACEKCLTRLTNLNNLNNSSLGFSSMMSKVNESIDMLIHDLKTSSQYWSRNQEFIYSIIETQIREKDNARNIPMGLRTASNFINSFQFALKALMTLFFS